MFAGDAIPVHLLTREAFQIYFQHLAKDGMLAVHISNRYLDLAPVVKSLADEFAATSLFFPDERSEWMVVGKPAVVLPLVRQYSKRVRVLRSTAKTPVWSDDYSNIFRALR